MPRYFFRVHVGDEGVAKDTIGLELANLGDAIAHANQARVEIMDEDALDRLWLEVMDQSGHVVARVPSNL